MKKNFIPWAKPDIGEEEISAVAESVRSTWIGGNGPLMREFADKFGKKIGVRYALPVNNGTSALICSLQGLAGLYHYRTIGVPTFTFLATVNTAINFGETALIDCNKQNWNMTIPKTVYDVLMPVDVAGLPIDYDAYRRFNRTLILVDSAEAVGSKYKGRYVGSQALVHTFSFHSAKVITTGEGGMITTNDKELYDLMNAITNQGYSGDKKPWEYTHRHIGFNYRMAEPQAALGLVQLKKLDKYVKERMERAQTYRDIIGDFAQYQSVPKYSRHNYFIFGILISPEIQREFCMEMLKNDIQVKVTFKPAHRQPCFGDIFEDEKYPNADWVWKRIVSLPNWNGMSEEQAKYVGETARRILK